MFSGCEWVDAMLWKAHGYGVECLDHNHLSTMLKNNNNNAALWELGCGLGVLGKTSRCLGAKAAVTDQDNNIITIKLQNLT